MKSILVFLCFFTLHSSIFAQGNDVSANPTGGLPITESEKAENPIVNDPVPTIAQYLQSSQSHKALLQIAQSLNLAEQFSNPGSRFTVLAPNDNAFGALARRLGQENVDASKPKQLVEQLNKGLASLSKVPSVPDLRAIVSYHLIGRPLPYEKLAEQGKAQTQNGRQVSFDGEKVIDLDDSGENATISTKNVFTQNGWVHVVTSVLIPFDLEAALKAASGVPDPTVTPVADDPTATPATAEESPATETTSTSSDEEPTPDSTDDSSTDSSPASSPDDDDDDDNVCFPASAVVHTLDGRDIPMNQLQAGEIIRHAEHNEDDAFSDVFLFTHRMQKVKTWFYQITTANGHSVTMTAKHYLHANNKLVSADAVVIGDVLRTVKGTSAVVGIRRVQEEGLYAPHTIHGDLVVNGVVVSGYSKSVHPTIAHALLTPVRWFVRTSGVVEPLGSLFYNGADSIATWVPQGAPRY